MEDETTIIAKTIYIQLGGTGFSRMIGMLTPLLVSEDSDKAEVTATFRWRARSKGGVNLMAVTLVQALDTYRVQFGRIHGDQV